MKTCFKCGAEKPLTDFYKHKGMKDGRVNKCKECNKNDVRENRAENVEYYRGYDAKRYKDDPKVRARHARYQKTEAGRASAAKSRGKWLANNADKRAAHVILGNAVRDGRVDRPDTCSECGSAGRIEGHHEDYTKPLDVIWLCRNCHTEAHRNLDKGPT